MSERAVAFGPDDHLSGVVTDPERSRGPAFLFLSSGITHRIGPSRLYVRLARALAARGFPSLRFDLSGIGYSQARKLDVARPEAFALDVVDAMDFLERELGVESFVACGICSGAGAAFRACRDPRVSGAALINPTGHLHGPDFELGSRLRQRALSRHSWRIALRSSFRAKNWKKSLRGQLDPRRLLRTMVVQPIGRVLDGRGEELPLDTRAELEALAERGAQLYHLYAEGDEGLDYLHVCLPDAERVLTMLAGSRFEVLRGTNHVFTLRWSQDLLVDRVLDWAETAIPRAGPASSSEARYG